MTTRKREEQTQNHTSLTNHKKERRKILHIPYKVFALTMTAKQDLNQLPVQGVATRVGVAVWIGSQTEHNKMAMMCSSQQAEGPPNNWFIRSC